MSAGWPVVTVKPSKKGSKPQGHPNIELPSKKLCAGKKNQKSKAKSGSFLKYQSKGMLGLELSHGEHQLDYNYYQFPQIK